MALSTYTYEQIGFGTVFNMFLVGYSYNLMAFIMEKAGVDYHFPKVSFGEGFVLSDFLWCLGASVVLIIVFVFFASIYMSVELGTAPYDALSVIIANSQKRFSLYRWHIADPVCFSGDIRVTIQALGWRRNDRYLPLQADISSVAYFYLDSPCADSKPLPDADGLEIC